MIGLVIGFIVLGILVAVRFIVPEVRYKKRLKTPMHPQYVGHGINYQPHLSTAETQGTKSALCPICRNYFNAWSRPAGTRSKDIFCDKCNEKIRARGDDFRPSCLTNVRDWNYLKHHKGDIFWIINGDYELGLIDPDEACRLMHSLVPKNFGVILPIPYRGYYQEAIYRQSNMGSSYSDHQCAICFEVGGCHCRRLYAEAIQSKKWPKTLNAYLSQLNKLQPKFVITGYHRKGNETHAIIEERSEFKVEDYFTFDDWRSIQWILNFSTKDEYTEETIQCALDQYARMIVEDWKILIKLHQAINCGQNPQIPVLPFTNPEDIKEIKIVPRSKTVQQRLEEKNFN